MRRSIALLPIWLIAAGAAHAAHADRDLMPSEATTLMVRAMEFQPTAERTAITAPIMARMKTDGSDATERFLEAEAHFINFDPEAARDGFRPFLSRDDDFGRVARQRLMIIRINAFEMVDAVVDRDLPAYRERFGIRPDDRYGVSYPLMQAARRLIDRGQTGRALDLVVEEVRAHAEFDAPHFAYRLPRAFLAAAREHGRGAEFEALHRWVLQGLNAAIDDRLQRSPPPERKAVGLPGATLGTLFEDRRFDHHDWTAEFLALKAILTAR